VGNKLVSQSKQLSGGSGVCDLKFRATKGSSLVELATGLLVLIPIVLVLFDLSVIVIAVQMNDSTCREAARVAASGNPLDAQTRAMAIISRANSRQVGMASNFTLVGLVSTVTAQDIQNVGSYGGPVDGTVTVETEVQVRPFVVQYIYNGQNPLHFRSKQSFPFTYVVPNTTTMRLIRLQPVGRTLG
jgi:Flp pilus assembly protein TadG